MRCRDCPYGIEDFTLRTEMYKSVYGEYPDEDRTNESEQFVWCDKAVSYTHLHQHFVVFGILRKDSNIQTEHIMLKMLKSIKE